VLCCADTLFFATVAVISIGSLNLSLLVNPVGLYQVRQQRGMQQCATLHLWKGNTLNGPFNQLVNLFA
jgi:hypothetical protein